MIRKTKIEISKKKVKKNVYLLSSSTKSRVRQIALKTLLRGGFEKGAKKQGCKLLEVTRL